MKNEHFEIACQKIREAYVSLGHAKSPNLSWRFLYTPKSTFHPKQKLMFVGLNPGGHSLPLGYKENPSFEEGNAYLLDQWREYEAGEYPLQKQIQMLFKSLSLSSGSDPEDWKSFMNQTLSLNFCPFRSPNWKSLKNKSETLSFCKNLWVDILEYICPKAIVTMDKETFGFVEKILENMQFKKEFFEEALIGWGKTTYTVCSFSREENNIILVRFPHLSRYKIFSSDQCIRPRTKVIERISQTLQC